MSERASEIQVAREKFNAAMKTIHKSVKQNMGRNFHRWGLLTLAEFKGGVYRRFTYHSGGLARSFSFQPTGKGDDTEGKFFSRHKGARLQEYGGTVKPKRARMLAIPIKGGPAMMPGGIPRYGSPLRTTLPSNFFFKVLEGGGSEFYLMGKKRGAKGMGKWQRWFSLRRSVYVPPRLKFKNHIANAVKALRELLARGAQEGIDGR